MGAHRAVGVVSCGLLLSSTSDKPAMAAVLHCRQRELINQALWTTCEFVFKAEMM